MTIFVARLGWMGESGWVGARPYEFIHSLTLSAAHASRKQRAIGYMYVLAYKYVYYVFPRVAAKLAPNARVVLCVPHHRHPYFNISRPVYQKRNVTIPHRFSSLLILARFLLPPRTSLANKCALLSLVTFFLRLIQNVIYLHKYSVNF